DKYKVDAAGTKGFATDFFEKYEEKNKKKPDEQKKAGEAIKSIINAEDYKNKNISEIEADLVTKIKAKETEFPLLNEAKSKEIAKELAPRLKLRDEKELNTAPDGSVKKKLAELLSWVEISYEGKTAADDNARFT